MSDLENSNGNGHARTALAPGQLPCCPKCGTELTGEFGEGNMTFRSGFVAHLLWCPNGDCRALLSMQIMGVAQKRVLPATAVPFNPTRKM